ncbi:RING finger protein 17 [Antennarius striatus]|uniref:RING finger protein 17 n=1 Tax=Antennarius striatus TaxID=241820 RepID=UPI0035B4C3E5
MDTTGSPDNVVCKLCGELFTLPGDDDVDSNLPRLLLCGHIYCTSCLLFIESDRAIRCPHCEVKTTVPEGGVCRLQEESRIIGLIYTSRVNKKRSSKVHRRTKTTSPAVMDPKTNKLEETADLTKIENMLDEALARGAENVAQLEQIRETLTNGLVEQLSRERARLTMEILEATDKAHDAVQKWKDVQLSELEQLVAGFPTIHMQLFDVENRIKSFETAMQMARQIRRIPFLERYCTIDKVLERLLVPVDRQSFDLKCTPVNTGISCVFKSDCQNRSISLSLRMEQGIQTCLSMSPVKDRQYGNSARKSPWHYVEKRKRKYTSPTGNKLPSPYIQDQSSGRAYIGLPQGFDQSPGPRRKPDLSLQTSASSPDVIIEEVIDETEEHAPPPTGLELASDLWSIHRTKQDHVEKGKNSTQWVVVTHIENPSHFYIHYVTDRWKHRALSKKINHFCSGKSCYFTSSDTVDTGSLIFVKWKKDIWCRATVVEVSQQGCVAGVETCPISQLASIRVFILDHGCTETISIHSEGGDTRFSLKTVNNQLRKVGKLLNVSLQHFAPQAVRCSLKDLVPYEPTKGWSEEAQVEFQNVVGSVVVEMELLGQDRDYVLVDLKKASKSPCSNVPYSVRGHLILVKVARFNWAGTLGREPLMYYPPVRPTIGTELKAVVSHINNPADFYLQLVDTMEFLLLSTEVQECYKDTVAGDDDLSVDYPIIGQAYVARYGDVSWYRAQVVGLPGDGKVKVFYVDFGSENIVSVSDLRKIPDQFSALPCMAIHCRLSDLRPLDGETWTEECTSRFISLTLNELVTVVVTESVSETEPLPVRVFESSLYGPVSNIAALLVKEDLAYFKKKSDSKDDLFMVGDDNSTEWDPPLELGSGLEGKDATNGEQEEDVFQPLLTLPTQVKDLKDLEVRVSHVNSPSSFYVQLTQYDVHLKRMCELVKQKCAGVQPSDKAWKAGMYCSAYIDSVWERGQICSDVTPGEEAEVMRCDHGNKVKVPVSDLRPLPSSLMGSFALECTLTNIRPAGGQSTWTATACDFISCYLDRASAIMTIKELTDERPVPVTFLCTKSMGQLISVADFLVGNGLALRERQPRDADVHLSPKIDVQTPVRERQTNGHKQHPPKPYTRIIISAEKVKTQMYQPPELPCLGHIQACVTAIGEDGIVYVRSKNTGSQLEQLIENIQQHMKTLPRPKPYTWKTVHGCAIMGLDMMWYRGHVLEVQGGNLKIQYVDSGLVESIPMVHVYPRLLCEEVPQLSVPCQLHNITPMGNRWQRDALALMEELLLKRCLDIQVMELPSDPRGTVTVQIFLDGLSLSRILCHHGHGFVEGSVSPQTGHSVMTPECLDNYDIYTEGLSLPEEPTLGPYINPILPKTGKKFQVRVKHLVTPNELFLWRWDETADLKVDGETLNEALTRITEDPTRLSPLTNFPQGGPCLAKYSDGKYYRAKLMEFTSIEPVRVMVQHVDFGSDDILPTSQIRQIPAELLAFPLEVMKAKVVGFKPPSFSSEDDVLPYSPEWSVMAAMEMMTLLHNNVTALVVARDPELTVLLYNQDGELIHMSLVRSGLAELE